MRPVYKTWMKRSTGNEKWEMGNGKWKKELLAAGEFEAGDGSKECDPGPIDIDVRRSLGEPLFRSLLCPLRAGRINLFGPLRCLCKEDHFFPVGHEKAAACEEAQFLSAGFRDLRNTDLKARDKWGMSGKDAEVADCAWCDHGFNRLTEDHSL